MKHEENRNLLLCYIHENRWYICFYFLSLVIFFCIFYLYHIPAEPVLYASGLAVFLGLIISSIRFIVYFERKKELIALQNTIGINRSELPDTRNYSEELYLELIRILQREKINELAESDNRISAITDYFTLWVHQIKTPIAAMDLLIQNNREDILSKSYEHWIEVEGELFKIQQYVDMVLQYLRLNDTINDFVLKEYELDAIIKQALHKYAPLFIRKKIKLNFMATQTTVVSDEKWLLFVIEQLLSNAIKYTKSGSISIHIKESGTKILIIEDTGIGILEEDLPRVFERGYTGYNGRKDKKATGIGLYLCLRILDRLSHKIAIESEAGKGTKVELDLS